MIYDYIIIGAGLGGLSAGLNLAFNKKKTLILEKNDLPGGINSTIKKGRFEFDTYLYDLYDYGDNVHVGKLKELIDKYKIDLDTKVVPFNMGIKEVCSNTNYVIKGEIEDFILELERLTEGSIEPIKKFIKITKEVNDAWELLIENKEIDSKAYTNFYKYLDYNALDGLKDLQIPEDTINLWGIFWLELGSPLNKIGFIDFSLFMYKLIFKKDVILINKTLDFTLKLVKRYQELGGKIYYNSLVCEVKKIDKYYVVKTKDNLEYKAKEVIFNVSPRYAYQNLIKEENKEINKRENARNISPNGVLVYLGLNRDHLDLNLKHYKYYVFDTLNSKNNINKMNYLDHNTLEAIVPNVVNDMASPKNTTILVLKRIYFKDVFNNITKDKYIKLKEDMALDLIEKFEEAFKIDIKEYIEEVEVLLPYHIGCISNRVNGSLFGYYEYGYDNALNRLLNYQEEKVDGYSFVGDFSAFQIGCCNNFLSGYYVTQKLLNKEG